MWNEESQGAFLECWEFFYIFILAMDIRLYTIIKIYQTVP